MYALAERLDPDAYYWLARATYAEMVLAGITCVGEFHYLHHGPGGTPYSDPNAMASALMYAARDAGLRLTLLDTLYLTANVDGTPLSGTQLRFADRDADAWASRVAALSDHSHARIGVAAHSIRAVPVGALPTVVEVAAGRPMHVHLSEQRAENAACQAIHRATPTQLLTDSRFLGPTTTAVHATHLDDIDRTDLGDTDTGVCFCPTTEQDLADGIGPARALVDAGCPLSLGSASPGAARSSRSTAAGAGARLLYRVHDPPAWTIDAVLATRIARRGGSSRASPARAVGRERWRSVDRSVGRPLGRSGDRAIGRAHDPPAWMIATA
jgi:formiminoglutamate deiminase